MYSNSIFCVYKPVFSDVVSYSIRSWSDMLNGLPWLQLAKSQMWPDLRKATFHAHNIKTHFSPLNDSCTRWLTIQAGIDAESYHGCFCCGLFLRPVRHPWVLGSPSNGYVSPWQADSWLKFTTRLAGEFGHGFSCFVWYV